jgi:hypothetical protein
MHKIIRIHSINKINHKSPHNIPHSLTWHNLTSLQPIHGTECIALSVDHHEVHDVPVPRGDGQLLLGQFGGFDDQMSREDVAW